VDNDHPRRRVGAVVAAVASLALVAGCSDSKQGVARNSAGKVTGVGTASVFQLKPADCLDPPADLSGEIDKIKVVPCDQAHTQEVFATVKSADAAYPGAEALATEANGSCLGAMQEPTLGLSPDDGYFVSYLLPSFDGWNKDKDRSIVCVFVFPDLGAVTGSVVDQAHTGTLKPGSPPPVTPVSSVPTGAGGPATNTGTRTGTNSGGASTTLTSSPLTTSDVATTIGSAQATTAPVPGTGG
jgi:hypothetical protein